MSVSQASEVVETVRSGRSNSDRCQRSRWSVYQLIWSGQLHTLKIGRRRLIRPAAYAACVNQLDNEAA
jgi:hypothetical protein